MGETLYRKQSCDCPQIGGPDCRAGYVPVERCEHGKIDEHDYLADKVDEHGRKFVAAEWCNGSPTLEVTDDE